ncbi:MAG: hypothetical protein LBU82_02355 [Treponema sp.]|nr:hypothetical protein [Treponema sp.]
MATRSGEVNRLRREAEGGFSLGRQMREICRPYALKDNVQKPLNRVS